MENNFNSPMDHSSPASSRGAITIFRLVFIILALVVLVKVLPRLLGGGRSDGPAPEIEVSEWLNCEPRSLADMRGSVIVLEFWAPW